MFSNTSNNQLENEQETDYLHNNNKIPKNNLKKECLGLMKENGKTHEKHKRQINGETYCVHLHKKASVAGFKTSGDKLTC